MIKSFLDDDLYKFTMCQAVCEKYPHAKAKYKFINRGNHKFPKDFTYALTQEINKLKDLKLTNEEYLFLKENCTFLTPVFLDFLKGYRYNPEEIKIFLNTEGEFIDLEIEGFWYRTILWEVKLMAIISELYFKMSDIPKVEPSTYKPYLKGKLLSDNNVNFADFGTRRRFSSSQHRMVAEQLKKAAGRHFIGSSNMLIAKTLNIKPIGTQAHEWIMYHGAKYGYRDANRMALKKWVDVFHGNLGIALSDTFTSNAFFKSFTSKYAMLFDGVRHDSGDPNLFASKTIQYYSDLGIPTKSKTIVFSDGLNVNKAIELNTAYSKMINCSFGIGTHFTNDIGGITPLNIVIKMTDCKPYGENNWLPVVKLSDTTGKHTGNPEEIDLCKKTLQINE